MLNLKILSRKMAQEVLATDRNLGHIKAMISISDSEPYVEKAPYGTARVPRVLRLIFDDTIDPNSSWQPPSIKDVQQIINFAKLLRSEDTQGELLIHCEAGISRSSSAALICLTTWGGRGSETKSVLDVYRLNHKAYPNTLMIKYADELLGRDGELSYALKTNPDAEIWNRAYGTRDYW